jgi:hypothetical protein
MERAGKRTELSRRGSSEGFENVAVIAEIGGEKWMHVALLCAAYQLVTLLSSTNSDGRSAVRVAGRPTTAKRQICWRGLPPGC